jgi:hypothetical protein
MSRKSNTIEFNKKSAIIHNNYFDYSLVDYKKSNIKVKIICPIHGIFEQRPNDHLSGQGCGLCNGNNKLPIPKIIERANKIHNNRYDYSLFTKYTNQKTIIDIICPIHGIFQQKINNHLNGKGCKYCANNIKKTNQKFINEANKIHDNLYDYSLSDYIDAKTDINVICRKHGSFFVSPNNHLSKKSGCPICNESKGELYVSKILDKYNIKYIREYKLYHKKYAPIYPLKADFYLMDYKIIIEYNGIQHYKAFDFFGGVEELNKLKKRDNCKKLICKNKNIKLIKISYKHDNFEKIEKLLKEYLLIN